MNVQSQSVELPEEGLIEARRSLRELQAEHPTKGAMVRIALGESTLESTLAHLNKRKNFQPSDDPRLVIRDGLKFDRELEERRIGLAEDLIRRVDPGPFEDPNYLALLAYQAASIEMALPNGKDGKPIDLGWSRFVLGTIHSREVNAFAQRFETHAYTVVAVYSALIEFLYQAAKAVIAVLHPGRSFDSRFRGATEAKDESIEVELDRNQEPLERLHRTLETYFFNGYPRAFSNEAVPQGQVRPLTHLIGTAERWIIAHEYGHGFAAKIDWERAPVENPAHAEEYFADNNATILTAISAEKLDAIPPDFALVGGIFALACLDIVRRGLSIVRYGKELKDTGDAEHPPNKIRAQQIFDAFNSFFGIDSHGQLILHLAQRPDPGPLDAQATRLRAQRVFRYPNALLAIWKRVRPRLQKDFEDKRALHSMWH